ncbi:glutathione transferase GstA [Niveispirillum sp. KHB5.9]|uniref:glutathione transferase GstA n=1 Tax=Niveispirillum sp. KHB5.9 TaxID=3400269 RepID=UPI003A84AED0
MKLYYKAGACSLASHIALREAGFAPEIEAVDLPTHRTAGGADYYAINPKGYIPALVLDGGEVLTEGVAIMQYVADQKPEAGLAPPAGTLGRARLQEALNFIATELHKSYSPLFNPATDAAGKERALAHLKRRLDLTESFLADGRDFLLGADFSVADGYLFTVLGWAGHVGLDLAAWPKLSALRARVAARPAVQATLKAEGVV